MTAMCGGRAASLARSVSTSTSHANILCVCVCVCVCVRARARASARACCVPVGGGVAGRLGGDEEERGDEGVGWIHLPNSGGEARRRSTFQ